MWGTESTRETGNCFVILNHYVSHINTTLCDTNILQILTVIITSNAILLALITHSFISDNVFVNNNSNASS